MLIDTHIHLYSPKFAGDLDAVVERARQAGVREMVLPAIDVASIHAALDLCERYDGLYAMAALHPSETRDATEADMDAVRALCDDPRVVAVGESGLDYYWDRSFDERQHAFLRAHVRLAMETGLPLVLHNREATDDLVRILNEVRAEAPDRLRGVFHCFGGPAWLADAAREMGFLLGVGGTLTFKNSGVAEVVREVPLAQIILETDAPYLAPAPHRGRRNEPAYLALVAERLADVKGCSVQEVAETTTANARRLFGLRSDVAGGAATVRTGS